MHLTADSEPVPEQVAQLAQEVYQQQLMPCLLAVMPRVEFEVRVRSNLDAQRHCAGIQCTPTASDWLAAADGRVPSHASDRGADGLPWVRRAGHGNEHGPHTQ